MRLTPTRWRHIARWVIRVVVSLLILVTLLVGIGMLPGKVEGVYAGGKIFQCACDSYNFMKFENGRVVIYSSAHPPAQLFGRYERMDDGSVTIYMAPLWEDETEEASYRASPGLWITRFYGFDEEDEKSTWIWKRPQLGNIRRTIQDQEISQTTIPEETTMVTTYYNSRFEKLRQEEKTIKPRNRPAAEKP